MIEGMSHSYLSILNQLYQRNLYDGMKLGLDNVRRLSQLLGDPHHQFSAIHVAGTNGKGTLVYQLAHGLERAGWKVGRFTSPHVSSFRERMVVNGELMEEEACVQLFERVLALADREGIPATFFELLTVAAFQWFAQEKVDVAVVETGMGGRLDATNILQPILAVITSVAKDHTEFLGATLEEIAQKKVGILKKGIPAVVGPTLPAHLLDPQAYPLSVTPHLLERCWELLAPRWNLSSALFEETKQVAPPCRFERFVKGGCVVLDVAHNPDGMRWLMRKMGEVYPKRPIHAVVGVSKGKDVEGILQALAPVCSLTYVAAASGRALSVEQLMELPAPADPVEGAASVAQGCSQAQEKAAKDGGVVLVTGSFFIMSEARAWLGVEEERDPWDLNELFPSQKGRGSCVRQG